MCLWLSTLRELNWELKRKNYSKNYATKVTIPFKGFLHFLFQTVTVISPKRKEAQIHSLNFYQLDLVFSMCPNLLGEDDWNLKKYW